MTTRGPGILGACLALFAGGGLRAQEPPAPSRAAPAAGPRVDAPSVAPVGPIVTVTFTDNERRRGVLYIPPGDDDGFLFYIDGSRSPVRFLWSEVEESDARRLRRSAAAGPGASSDAEAEGYWVPGVRVVLTDERVLEGIDVTSMSDDKRLVLKQAGLLTPVARDRIAQLESVKLSLIKVYTPREIRDQILQRFQPQDERQWHDVGVQLQAHGLADEARDVFRIVEILRRRELPLHKFYADLRRLQDQLVTSEAQVAAYEVGRRVLDERYEEALGLLRQIEEHNRDEALAGEIRRIRGGIEALRERRLEDRLVDEGYTQIRSLVTAKAVDRTAGFADSAAYVDKVLFGEVMDRLASQYHLDRPSVERIWDRRPHQRTFLARYGEGTWVQMRPASDDPEAWWAAASSTARFEYLEARFAEQSMRVVKASAARCPQCGGQGLVSYAVSTTPAGGMCPACRGAKVSRVVYYR